MGKNKKSMQGKKTGENAGNEHAGKNPEQDTRELNEKETARQNGQNDDSASKTELGEESKEAISGLQEKLKEKEDKYLRLAAEFDNYRKRTLREKADLSKMIGGDIIAGLLPVIDDFDRAIGSLGNQGNPDAMQLGVMLIYDKFREYLKQRGVKEIEALGTQFDTDLHEAVTKIPAPSKNDKGKIVDVIVKGYVLHDRVIRYAKVVVGE